MADTDTGKIRKLVAEQVASSSPIKKAMTAAVAAALLGGGVCAGLEASVRLGETEIHVHDVGEP